MKSVDEEGVDRMILLLEDKEVGIANCGNAIVCRWIKEFEKEDFDKAYRLLTVSATGVVTEKDFNILKFGHPESKGIIGERLFLGFKVSDNWVIFLVILLIVLYMLVKVALHVLKKKGKVKITKPRKKYKLKRPGKLFKPHKFHYVSKRK